ncbi:50S ribosomal protein L25/general stress protein Ctc [Actinomadura alba]|uniref:Large ribosomal subunit protein bL25 n=1 Tax=Actinomadura alba TaxID=406431 RepID=A0ABR7LRT9_9ACTN|nr:50S ribosomal protein L25/general stress protein Ctc [Actinomadura alba]MBC6467200.1 50S ribosomal protein L25/general stress protein Ctc [Actinomadura alba]
MSEVRIAAEPRTEFGKGAARRTRRAGKVPAVLYGHGTDPQHISLPGHDLMRALKTPNVLLRVQGLDGGEELALPKDVQRDPIKGFLEHIDLLLVKLGEKVNVEIPVQVTGDIAPGGMLDQQMVQIEVEAEATQIPQAVEVDVAGFKVGATVLAKDLKLPRGVALAADEELLILHVVAEKTADQVEAEISGEAPEAEAETAEAGAESTE